MPITTITIITRASMGSGGPSISADGQFVAFYSGASNLVPGDTNGEYDVFVKNVLTGEVTRVSSDASDRQGNASSFLSGGESISADGRFVAFYSGASNLVPGDTNGQVDVFVKDLQTGAITRANTDSAGRQADDAGDSSPSISADGRFVAFSSGASNLVPGDTNGQVDIFVKDLQTGVITRANTDSAGGQANDDADSHPSISADGRFVVFVSTASNLVPGDTNDQRDVFLKDLQTGAITRVSTDSAGGQVNDGSGIGSISPDGRFALFASAASNLVPGDTNDRGDVFLKDLQTGAITRVSTDSAGGQANGDSWVWSMSADGRFITFLSFASNLVADDADSSPDIFVKDLQTGMVAQVNINSAGEDANAGSLNPEISADGRFITFESLASNLVAGDRNGAYDVFITPNPLWETTLPSLTEGPDSWTGTAGNDTVDALGGADSLDGAGGADVLFGRAGNDTLVGGSGADTLYGGEGDDLYIVDASDLIGDEPAGQGLDIVRSSGSFTLGTGLNQLILTGSAASSGTGNDGNNLIGGNGGWNRLFGQGGADDLYGQGGNDTLDGGTGNDLLIGGAGSDRLTGGAGGDRFVFTGAEVTDATADLDVITDYSRAAGDVVDLADPVHGYTVIGVVGGALQIHLVGGNDIVQFDGITNVADILFV